MSIVNRRVAAAVEAGRELVELDLALPADMAHLVAGQGEEIGDELAMTVAMLGLGAHQRDTPPRGAGDERRDAGVETRAFHVVGETAECRIGQRGVARVAARLAEAAEGVAGPHVSNVRARQQPLERGAVEMRIPS